MPPPLNPLAATPAAVWRRITQQQVTDRSLTVLTLLLLAEIVLMPPLVEIGWVGRHVADIVFVAGLSVGVWILADETLPGRLFIGTAAVTAGLRLANVWLPDADVRQADASFAAINLGVLGWLTLAYTLAPGRINVHRVLGAVAAFLLIGLMFAQLHRLVAMNTEHAYLLLGQPADYSTIVTKLGYYSFVTLTSLGYGDITPLHPVARALAMLEALIGVLYPVALLGWLVSVMTLQKK
ncbi:MAG TPA: potassium channel family protein [Methylibium sp.]|uniref:potassium channel family protein n=1 Tax=Methylibium sp. TaxID=2067992 RepID=UPI002DBEF165|nr:potassium channel family protein [Methylibium sp.]HEU4458494.1 potassium channel family protein [Methylibium sp.]